MHWQESTSRWYNMLSSRFTGRIPLANSMNIKCPQCIVIHWQKGTSTPYNILPHLHSTTGTCAQSTCKEFIITQHCN